MLYTHYAGYMVDYLTPVHGTIRGGAVSAQRPSPLPQHCRIK
jgi:hypothetical protein